MYHSLDYPWRCTAYNINSTLLTSEIGDVKTILDISKFQYQFNLIPQCLKINIWKKVMWIHFCTFVVSGITGLNPHYQPTSGLTLIMMTNALNQYMKEVMWRQFCTYQYYSAKFLLQMQTGSPPGWTQPSRTRLTTMSKDKEPQPMTNEQWGLLSFRDNRLGVGNSGTNAYASYMQTCS